MVLIIVCISQTNITVEQFFKIVNPQDQKKSNIHNVCLFHWFVLEGLTFFFYSFLICLYRAIVLLSCFFNWSCELFCSQEEARVFTRPPDSLTQSSKSTWQKCQLKSILLGSDMYLLILFQQRDPSFLTVNKSSWSNGKKEEEVWVLFFLWVSSIFSYAFHVFKKLFPSSIPKVLFSLMTCSKFDLDSLFDFIVEINRSGCCSNLKEQFQSAVMDCVENNDTVFLYNTRVIPGYFQFSEASSLG